MSVFETDNYKMAKSEEPQSTSQYTPFEDSQFNYINDINSGVYSSNPTLVQFDLTSIMSHNAFTSCEDLFVTIPLVMVGQFVTAAGLGIAPTGDTTGASGTGQSSFTAGTSLGYAASLLSLKGSYQSLVHQCELSVGGRVVSDLQPFTNIYTGFRLASQMSGGTDLRASATSLGLADVGLDNQNSVSFNSKLNPATADTIMSSGGGLVNNRPFAGSIISTQVYGTQVQGVIGNQNKYVVNDAIGRRLSRYVDASGTGGVNGVYGTSGGQGSGTLTIMTATQLATELKPTVTLVQGQATTAQDKNYIVYQDTAVLPLKYLFDVVNKLPMMKRTDMLLRLYLNTGSLIVPVIRGSTDAAATQYFSPQSSNFVNTCPFTVNYLGAGVPANTVAIAAGIFVAKTQQTSLSIATTSGASFVATTAPVNLGACLTSHGMTACRTYFNQISLTPEKEEEYLLANTAKPVIYERFIYNQYNNIASSGTFSQLIASGVKNPLACIIIPFISTNNLGLSGDKTLNFPAQYSSPFDTCGGISFAPISLTNLQVSVGMKNVLQNSLYFTYENYLEQVCQYESVSGNSLDILNKGIISQAWWEQNRVYFVNLSRGSPADRATPRNILVSFNNNTNIIIDCMIYVVYADRIVVNVRTGMVSQG